MYRVIRNDHVLTASYSFFVSVCMCWLLVDDVEPVRRSELDYKEGEGELLRPGWLAWAAETPC